jgi:hypothetical protein
MSRSLITSLVLFFGNHLFSAIIGLHLFNSNPVSMAIEDEELEKRLCNTQNKLLLELSANPTANGM